MKETVQGLGDGEDDVIVVDRKEVLEASLDPSSLLHRLALGTVPIPAGVIKDFVVPTPIAYLDSSSHGFSPAVSDGQDGLPLPGGERGRIRRMLAENVSEFQGGSSTTGDSTRRTTHVFTPLC